MATGGVKSLRSPFPVVYGFILFIHFIFLPAATCDSYISFFFSATIIWSQRVLSPCFMIWSCSQVYSSAHSELQKWWPSLGGVQSVLNFVLHVGSRPLVNSLKHKTVNTVHSIFKLLVHKSSVSCACGKRLAVLHIPNALFFKRQKKKNTTKKEVVILHET